MSKKSADRSRSQRAQAALAAQAAAERRRRMLVVGAVVAVLVVIVVVGFLVTRGKDTTGEQESSTPAGTDGYSVFVGDADAPKQVTIYEDLQCPACAVFEAQTADAVTEAVDAGDLRVEYRMVAFLDEASKTDYSSRALNALMVVLDTSGTEVFADFHRLLYENQPAEDTAGLTDDQLIEYAVESGADEDEIRGPIEDKQFAQWVVNATDQMSQDGVRGTPTVVIDGKAVEGDPSVALLDLLG